MWVLFSLLHIQQQKQIAKYICVYLCVFYVCVYNCEFMLGKSALTAHCQKHWAKTPWMCDSYCWVCVCLYRCAWASLTFKTNQIWTLYTKTVTQTQSLSNISAAMKEQPSSPAPIIKSLLSLQYLSQRVWFVFLAVIISSKPNYSL